MPIPAHIQTHLSKDKKLLKQITYFKDLIEEQTPHTRIYEELINSIIGQQLSTKAAESIRTKFLTAFGGIHPTPEHLVSLSPEDLRTYGLSGQKSGYLINVAQFWIDRNLTNTQWNDLTVEAIIELLTQIKGVGRWTVEMVLIFDLGRDDVFPYDDLGVRNGMALVYNKDPKSKSFKEWATTQSQKWAPYRSWGSRLMWKAYDNRIK